MIDSADIQRIIRDYYEQLYMPIQWTTWKKWTDYYFFFGCVYFTVSTRMDTLLMHFKHLEQFLCKVGF